MSGNGINEKKKYEEEEETTEIRKKMRTREVGRRAVSVVKKSEYCYG